MNESKEKVSSRPILCDRITLYAYPENKIFYAELGSVSVNGHVVHFIDKKENKRHRIVNAPVVVDYCYEKYPED